MSSMVLVEATPEDLPATGVWEYRTLNKKGEECSRRVVATVPCHLSEAERLLSLNSVISVEVPYEEFQGVTELPFEAVEGKYVFAVIPYIGTPLPSWSPLPGVTPLLRMAPGAPPVPLHALVKAGLAGARAIGGSILTVPGIVAQGRFPAGVLSRRGSSGYSNTPPYPVVGYSTCQGQLVVTPCRTTRSAGNGSKGKRKVRGDLGLVSTEF